MARKVNEELTEKIVECLKKHPEGTYISEIGRELNLAKSTVAYILQNRLQEKIKEIKVGQKGLFKIIKLKQNNLKTPLSLG